VSREAILSRLRAALAEPSPRHPERPAPPHPAQAGAHPVDPVAEFEQRFRALGGIWHRADGPAHAAQVIGELVGRDGQVWLATGAEGPLDRHSLERILAARSVAVLGSLGAAPGADSIRVGVTSCLLGIAESGTLVLAAEPEQGRLPSVLPPVHVALITPDRVVATLGEALARVEPLLAGGSTSAVILISGPSRTGDIEGRLVVGVHGPGEIHCILVG
jgi:L-lactate dehydrogenase complex protein LldG